jgi:hypothetical protein
MKTSNIFILLIAVLALAGCTIGQGVRFTPATHFVHPNSNVKILGPVTAEITGGVSILVPPPVRTSADDEKLYNAALSQQPGADVIVDSVVTSKVKMIPLPYISIFYVTHKIEGYGAKKIVGKQELL